MPMRPLVTGFFGGSGGGDDWFVLLDGFSGSLGGISLAGDSGGWEEVLVGTVKLAPDVS